MKFPNRMMKFVRDLVDRITADTGRHSRFDPTTAAVNQEVRSYAVTEDAVYFAFRDSGACISILNVKVITFH